MFKNCRICGKEFETPNSNYCTCSPACSIKNAKALNKKWRANNADRTKKYNANRTRKYKKPIILCGICGEEVPQICSERGYSRKRYHEKCVVNEALKAIAEGKQHNDKRIVRAWNTFGYSMKELKEIYTVKELMEMLKDES